MKKFFLSLLLTGALVACKDNPKNNNEENPASAKAQTEQSNQDGDWITLFDGTDAKGWRGFNEPDGSGLPKGWVVEDNSLKSLGEGGDIGGDIVYGPEEFGEFELSLDWKLSEGGNSGIFYHVKEGDQYKAAYFTAPEYQIIDQKGFPSKLESWQSIGADYGVYDPEFKEEDLKPIGQWNTSKIRYTNNKVTYWLNGKKTVEFDPSSDDWQKRRNEGKWKDFPDYAKTKTGLIGLQDHGSFIWFKNIKIKKL